MVRTEELKGMVGRVGGEPKQRKVWEVLDSAAGPPPLPLKSAYSSRSPSSRQVGCPADSVRMLLLCTGDGFFTSILPHPSCTVAYILHCLT